MLTVDDQMIELTEQLGQSIADNNRLRDALIEAHGAVARWGAFASSHVEQVRLQADLDAIVTALRYD